MEKTIEAKAGLPALRQLVAGIDIGSEEHWVAGPPKPDGTANVRRFKTTTEQLKALVDWLETQHIESVAMESTGMYWIPIYELLEARGIEAVLVNAKEFHNVPGRPKTDIRDCQWLQQLHSCGLLRGSFRPHEDFLPIRALQRQVANLVHQRTRYIQWMQKSLDQMNVQVHHAVSDLSGVTGLAMVRAIVAGERNPEALAALRDHRCTKSAAEIAPYLVGNWRAEHLFNLKSTLRLFDAMENEIAEYEKQIDERLDALAAEERREKPAPAHPNPKKEKHLRSHGECPLRDRLWRCTGSDLTRIDGLSTTAVKVILAELGTQLGAFPSEHHFVSWLRLCPRTAISGGRALKKRRNGLGANRIANVLHMAAKGLSRGKTALGAYFRDVSRVKGYAVAVFATARKLAQLVYRALRYGQDYVDVGEAAHQERHAARRLTGLQNAARAQGFMLVPVPT